MIVIIFIIFLSIVLLHYLLRMGPVKLAERIICQGERWVVYMWVCSYDWAQMDTCGPVNTVWLSPLMPQQPIRPQIWSHNFSQPWTCCLQQFASFRWHRVLFGKLHYTCSHFIQTPSHGNKMFQPIYTHIPPLLHYSKPLSLSLSLSLSHPTNWLIALIWLKEKPMPSE